jgi:hypothetical protein
MKITLGETVVAENNSNDRDIHSISVLDLVGHLFYKIMLLEAKIESMKEEIDELYERVGNSN